MQATLTFQDLTMAKDFASQWPHKTLMGHDISAIKKDGNIDMTVYNITPEYKDWIDFIYKMQIFKCSL